MGAIVDALRFLAIGECMAEFAPTVTPDTYKLGFAGDTFNTAWYLRKLLPDATVGYLTRIGDDMLSRRMLQTALAADIDTGLIGCDPGHSIGIYLISLTQGERSFSYWREHSPARHLANDPAALDAAIANADLIYFSGVTLAIIGEAGRQNLFDALRRGREAGKSIAFDPNLRPQLWPDHHVMCAATMEAARLSDIALPSFDDETSHFGDQSAGATIARYVSERCRIVVVKNGGKPIQFYRDGHYGVFMPPNASEIVDTTAAGDSFNAGILAGLYADETLEAAVQTACRVAGQVIAQTGALVPVNTTIELRTKNMRLHHEP